MRTKIHAGILRGEELKLEINKYLGNAGLFGPNIDEVGYDDLDMLLNGIFPIDIMPDETREREPEMVYYQKTPARIIFELSDKIDLKRDDILYDLGSGLGQVSIWINLLTEIKTKGVEFEPEFCEYAKTCMSELDLKNVEFICADARSMNYSDGTVFYLYTPFTGSILKEVLEILQHESKKRPIRIFTYGPCTLQIAKESWLICEDEHQLDENKLCEFKSL